MATMDNDRLRLHRRVASRIRRVFGRKQEDRLEGLGPDNPGNTAEIRLYDMSIGDDRVWHIAGCLRNNPTVKTLNLSRNRIGPNGAIALCMALKSNQTLERVSLGGNETLGVGGVCALAEGLNACSVKHFALPRARVTDEGAQALASSLARPSCSLQDLFLQSNCIGNVGAMHLGKALATNTSLHALDLSDNLIGDDGVAALVEGVTHNTTLRNLCLGDNGFSLAALVLLEQLSRNNAHLRILDVKSHSTSIPESHSEHYRQISYHLSLNQAGRHYICSDNPLPCLLPKILERINWKPELLYGLIQEAPHLFVQA